MQAIFSIFNNLFFTFSTKETIEKPVGVFHLLDHAILVQLENGGNYFIRREEFLQVENITDPNKIPDSLKSNDETQLSVGRIYFKKERDLHKKHKKLGRKKNNVDSYYQKDEYYLYFNYLVIDGIDPTDFIRHWHLVNKASDMSSDREEYMNPYNKNYKGNELRDYLLNENTNGKRQSTQPFNSSD